jgi:impB/mucB/samB family/BRCT domain, a BRCA1 C-terminus domain
MVKPPKSMRPESVADMSKAGRAQTKSFQDSSFHTYMARKIHLQRKQFGVVLPPPPRPPKPQPPDHCDESSSSDEPTRELLLQATPEQSSQHRVVRFSSDGDGSVGGKSARRHGSDASSPENSLNASKASLGSSKKRAAPSVAGLGGLLKRLKRRHGDVALTSATPTETTPAASPASTAGSHALDQSPAPLNHPSPGNETASLKENAQHVGGLRSTSILAQSIQEVETSHTSSKPPPIGSAAPPPEIASSRRRLNRRRRQRSSEDGTMADDDSQEDRPDLFLRGVVVLINGYTEPDAGTLQRMLHRHGGSVEKYETDHVTAVIASELSFAKAEVYRNLTRRPLPVVTPDWIVDSVRAQALLPYQNYILGRMRINKYGGAVQSIERFFASSKAASPTATEFDTSAASATDGTSRAQSDGSHVTKSRLPATLSSKEEAWGETAQAESDKRLPMSDQVLPRDISETVDPKENVVIDLTTGDAIDQLHLGPHVSNEIGSTPVAAEAANETLLLPGIPALLESTLRDDSNPGGNSVPSNLLVSLAQTQESAHEDEDDGNCTGDVFPLQPIARRAVETPLPSPTANSSGRAEPVKDRVLPPSRSDDKLINGRVRTVGTDPNFLENFFSKSRLSFIGSFKQRARSSPAKVTNSANQPPNDTQRWVFHVDIDSFFASVILRDYPQYRDMPVVVSHQGSGNQRATNHSSTSTSECATCNYKVSFESERIHLDIAFLLRYFLLLLQARDLGIKKGMFLGRANELCKSAGCQLIVLPYDFHGYEEVNEKVAEILFRYALEFNGRVNQVSCDEAYMELFLPVRDSASISNDIESIAESIRREVFDATECTASIGVANNLFLAKVSRLVRALCSS